MSSAYDWNAHVPLRRGSFGFRDNAVPIRVVDETLREGLQSVSGSNARVSLKIDLLHAMADVGVDVVSIGLPAAGQRHEEDAVALGREIVSARLPLTATAAARTVASDVEAVARVADRIGASLEVYAFIASSPIRMYVEGWDEGFLIRAIRTATDVARRAGLAFCLVTEDSTRAHPNTLRTLLRAALDGGAKRVCLCDTVGHATREGVCELLRFVRRELATLGASHLGLDWHGHDDQGLGLSNALWAVAHGIERVHGTGLGVGERVGNTSLELLVHNLALLGFRPPAGSEALRRYTERASQALSWPIPPDHPLVREGGA